MVKTFESGGGMEMSTPSTGGNSKVIYWVLGAVIIGGLAYWGYTNFVKKPKTEEKQG